MSTPLDAIREKLARGEALGGAEALAVDTVLTQAAGYDANNALGGELSTAIRKLNQPNRVLRTDRLKAIANELFAMIEDQAGTSQRKELTTVVQMLRNLATCQ